LLDIIIYLSWCTIILCSKCKLNISFELHYSGSYYFILFHTYLTVRLFSGVILKYYYLTSLSFAQNTYKQPNFTSLARRLMQMTTITSLNYLVILIIGQSLEHCLHHNIQYPTQVYVNLHTF